jgi:hypothetical protein
MKYVFKMMYRSCLFFVVSNKGDLRMLETRRFSRKLAKDYNENLFWLEKSPPCLWPLAKLPPEPAFDKIVRIHVTFPSKIF